MRDWFFILLFVLVFAPAIAGADEDEWVWDLGLGPRIQLLSEDRPTGEYSTTVIDWTSPYVGLRYGLLDVGRYGVVELGVSGQYSAEDDAVYRDVEWEVGKFGDVLENTDSWNAAAEVRFKWGVRLIPYATAGLGWHRRSIYNIDFISSTGLRIAHYPSQLVEVPYVSGGVGLEWRFSNYWSSSLDGAFNLDIGEENNQIAVPIRLKFSYYMQD